MQNAAPSELLERIKNATAGRFEILRELDRGEMDAGFEAVDLQLDRHIALMVLVQDAHPIERSEYASAIRNAMKLHHPGILGCYSMEETDGLMLFVMQFEDAVSLADIRQSQRASEMSSGNEGPAVTEEFQIDFVQSIISKVADALAYAHNEGVVHGGLTPSSVMITNEGKVFVRGFGVPTLTGAVLRIASIDENRRARYSSPEQCEGAPATSSSDQYALGIIAYEVLTGDPPFAGTVTELCIAHLTQEPIPLAVVRADIAPRMAEAIMRMLSKKPSDRFSQMTEIVRELSSNAHNNQLDERVNFHVINTAILARDASSSSKSSTVLLDENVQFTAYRPSVVRPAEWYPMLVFAHLSEAPAGSSEPDPVTVVEHQAKQILEQRISEFQKLVQDSSQAIPREGTLTFVPEIAGVEFNPPRQSFHWVESVHRAEFRMRAAENVDGQVVRGRLTVYFGAIIVADIALSVRVNSGYNAAPAVAYAEPAQARPYRKIFASYSHKDVDIVRQFERYAATLGDRYLLDANDLRAGEVWSDRLTELIREADIVQLFWSSNSMVSEFVRKEWEYALSLGRPNFIRPTYWENPMPALPSGGLPPDTLLRLQFQQIPAISKRERRSVATSDNRSRTTPTRSQRSDPHTLESFARPTVVDDIRPERVTEETPVMQTPIYTSSPPDASGASRKPGRVWLTLISIVVMLVLILIFRGMTK